MQGVKRGVAHRSVELRRCDAAGRLVGKRGDFLRCMAAACWRRGSCHLRVVGNFAQAAV